MTTCSAWSDPQASGDNLYIPRSCPQDFIDWVWDAYDFDKGDWDNGFGWEAACDVNRPLARAFNALWCLEYSAPDPLNESYSMPIINWAGRYSRSHIDELDASCATDAVATTVHGAFIDNYTELKLKFFFERGVSERAGTIIHEARHAAGKSHDDDKLDSSWGYNGAWRWHVCWLAWFLNQCTNSSPAMKTLALDRANAILDDRFTTHPGFVLNEQGFAV